MYFGGFDEEKKVRRRMTTNKAIIVFLMHLVMLLISLVFKAYNYSWPHPQQLTAWHLWTPHFKETNDLCVGFRSR